MKRRWTRLFIVVAVVTIAAAALPASAAGTAATTDDFEHGTLVVRYAAGTSSQQQADIARRNGATIRAVHAALGVVLLNVPDGKVLATQRALDRERGVVYAEPNGIVHASLTPNDTSWSSQWGPAKIQPTPAGLSIRTPSAATKVAPPTVRRSRSSTPGSCRLIPT